jgi:hypothetical protein
VTAVKHWRRRLVDTLSPVKSRVIPIMLLILVAVASRAAAQTRIMPLGDSITEAESGFASYRYWLWHALLDAGHDVDLVGSMSGVYNGPPLFNDFDQDHEGHWGWRVDEVLAQLPGWAAAAQPEIVLLHLGHNDLWQGQGVAGTITELEAVISALRTANPTVTVLIAEVIPATPTALSEIPALNAEVATLATSLTTVPSPVIAVDHWTGFDPVLETYDGVHPNQAGEQKMSATWFAALVGVLGPAPTVFRDGFEDGTLGAWTEAVAGLLPAIH